MKTLEDDGMKHDNFPNIGCIGAIKWMYGKFCNGEELNARYVTESDVNGEY